MDSDEMLGMLGTLSLSVLAGFIGYTVYKKVKDSGVEDDMGFRLIWLIIAFGTLYVANIFREEVNEYAVNDFLYMGVAGVVFVVGLYIFFVLITTIGTKLGELGATKIWKKLLYSAVISSVAAWAATALGITEAVTLAKVAIGGAVIFSVQLLS